MNLQVDVEKLFLAHKAVRAELLAERGPSGCWTGRIGSSPVATAAAVSALVAAYHQDSVELLREATADDGQVIEQLVQCDLSELLLESVHWLAKRQNDDGGWGDCDGAESNVAATLLVQAAFRLTGIPAKYADLMVRADQYVAGQGGQAGLKRQIGNDKTLLASILANSALADLGEWRKVPTQPFEWYALPLWWQRDFLRLASRCDSPLVMAVGLAKFHHDPPRNPLTRLLRGSLKKKALACLAQLQSADDSYLASPLATAIVVMNVASMGLQEHPIVTRGVDFLLSSVRADASWANTVNLSTINTSLAIESLSTGQFESAAASWSDEQGSDSHSPPWQDTSALHAAAAEHSVLEGSCGENHVLNITSLDWLLNSQQLAPNHVTGAPAGGWGHTDTAGALPSTPATAAALIALAEWRRRDENAHRARVERAAEMGMAWLLDLQNGEGGWPTYFNEDRPQQFEGGGVDSTAAAVRALAMWQRVGTAGATIPALPSTQQRALAARIGPALERAWQFLESQQRDDGSFVPVWFGNEHQADDENPVLGTSQVLAACAAVKRLDSKLARRAAAWLAASQHADGGWGPPRMPVDYSDDEKGFGQRSWRENDVLAKFCTVEETAAALSALLPVAEQDAALERNVSRGLAWLTNAVEDDACRRPAIIGFYFSRIWYYERLYPLAFATGALSRAVGRLAPARATETALR